MTDFLSTTITTTATTEYASILFSQSNSWHSTWFVHINILDSTPPPKDMKNDEIKQVENPCVNLLNFDSLM